jgi:ribosomal protein S18 acetylase RimI-like enzyme
MLVIREVERVADASALNELNTSFTSEFVYRVVSEEDSLHLKLTIAPSRIQMRFPIDLDESLWQHGYVVEQDGKVCGFVATRYEPWNRRLVIVHLYVDFAHRRQGIGRRLMQRAIESGKTIGALTAWVETSNVNHPGILAYQRLGFSLCGFDLTLYQRTQSEGEFALYLARPIAG